MKQQPRVGRPTPPDPQRTLSGRDIQVLECLAAGHSTAQIAAFCPSRAIPSAPRSAGSRASWMSPTGRRPSVRPRTWGTASHGRDRTSTDRGQRAERATRCHTDPTSPGGRREGASVRRRARLARRFACGSARRAPPRRVGGRAPFVPRNAAAIAAAAPRQPRRAAAAAWLYPSAPPAPRQRRPSGMAGTSVHLAAPAPLIPPQLSARELEVLQCPADTLLAAEVAAAPFISVNTRSHPIRPSAGPGSLGGSNTARAPAGYSSQWEADPGRPAVPSRVGQRCRGLVRGTFGAVPATTLHRSAREAARSWTAVGGCGILDRGRHGIGRPCRRLRHDRRRRPASRARTHHSCRPGLRRRRRFGRDLFRAGDHGLPRGPRPRVRGRRSARQRRDLRSGRALRQCRLPPDRLSPHPRRGDGRAPGLRRPPARPFRRSCGRCRGICSTSTGRSSRRRSTSTRSARSSKPAESRAKCTSLEAFGRVLHGAQDFYAHSNWADEADPTRPIGADNPPGLNLPGPSSGARPSQRDAPAVPSELITGCFVVQDEVPGVGECEERVTHAALNKDNGLIDPETGEATGPTTPRGMVGENFSKAVAGAIVETRRQWQDFQSELAGPLRRRRRGGA